MTRDYTADMEPVLRPVLEPAERLLAASPLVTDPGTTADVDAADELRNLLDPTILLGLGSHPGNLLQRAAYGRAVTGSTESIGRWLHATVDAVLAPQLAVTDRRLLVFEIDTTAREPEGWWRRWFGPVDRTARVVRAVPRAAVVGAVRAPSGVLRRGRFLVVCADGSTCALVCAPPSLAERAVAAIGPPRPLPDTPPEEQE
ncbi:MAG TPA: hypothetical protein VGD43_05755 [Micromonospora sp.]